MNRGIFFAAASLLGMQAHAHVSHAEGMQHASEHLWLLLALVPAVMLLRPLVRRLIRSNRR